MHTVEELVGVCLALIGGRTKLSVAEQNLVDASKAKAVREGADAVARAIREGMDPLGDAFLRIRSADDRRADGAVYTPTEIVRSMTRWIASQEKTPARIVDPGAGSGRFILAAAAMFPKARLVAVEMDPLAAMMLRANLAARGWASRATVMVDDYRNVQLPRCAGVTAFIGNPPYVRHHDIGENWKAWYSTEFAALGIKASALAGLHLHFFLQTYLLAKPGDIGTFVTSAEWLDVNYGSALRRLLMERLGGVGLHVLQPTVEAFPGTATTAAITCFRVAETTSKVKVRSVETLDALNGLSKGSYVSRTELKAGSRWSIIVRPTGVADAEGIELGELFRVHRGQVTGANSIWIAGEQAASLPDRVKLPTVTKARDLIVAGSHLNSASELRRVIDLPPDLDVFTAAEKRRVAVFLKWAKAHGGDESYIAQHRKAWWSVGLRDAAPILCTYMARRPPQFTLNSCDARHINIAHGLYPRQKLPVERLAEVVAWLNGNISASSGRTYAGGLTKFEPKEIERLRVPSYLAA